MKPGECYLCSICKQQVLYSGYYDPHQNNKGLVCIECNKPPIRIRAVEFLRSLVDGFIQLILGVLVTYIIYRALWGIFNAP